MVGGGVGSYPLSSQAPTQVEVELGCDNTKNSSLPKFATLVSRTLLRPKLKNQLAIENLLKLTVHQHILRLVQTEH